MENNGHRGGISESSRSSSSGKRRDRRLELKENIVVIRDRVSGHAAGYLHLAPGCEYVCQEEGILVEDRTGKKICRISVMPEDTVKVYREGSICSYAPDFGKTEQIQVMEILWNICKKNHKIQIQFEQEKEE